MIISLSLFSWPVASELLPHYTYNLATIFQNGVKICTFLMQFFADLYCEQLKFFVPWSQPDTRSLDYTTLCYQYCELDRTNTPKIRRTSAILNIGIRFHWVQIHTPITQYYYYKTVIYFLNCHESFYFYLFAPVFGTGSIVCFYISLLETQTKENRGIRTNICG